MVERLTGKSFGYPGYRFMFPPGSIFNDPGKEFEVQLIGPDLNQLAGLEQQISKLRSYLSRMCSDFVTGALSFKSFQSERLAEVGLSAEVGAMVEAVLVVCFEICRWQGGTGCSAVAKCFVETPELRQLSLYSRGQQSAAATNTKVSSLQMSQKYGRQRDQMSLTMWIRLDYPTVSWLAAPLVEQAENQILTPKS